MDFWVYYSNLVPIRIDRDSNYDGIKDEPKEREELFELDFSPSNERGASYKKIFKYYYSKGKLIKYEFIMDGKLNTVDYFDESGINVKSQTYIDGKLIDEYYPSSSE